MFTRGPTWTFLGLCCFVSCTLSFLLVRNHWRSYSQPVIQRKIISILWMVPIYSVSSWLSMRFTSDAMVLDMIRDCYEGYVVYMFFSLCVAYIGQVDPETVDTSRVERVLQEKEVLHHPPPFQWCKPINLRTGSIKFIVKCKFYILQFVLVKPLCTFLALILSVSGRYTEGEIDFTQSYVYLAFVENVSVSLSLYYLVLFFMATKGALAPFSPLPKFVCIKFVIFFSWWQGVVLAVSCWINVLPVDHAEYSCHTLSTSIQNFLVGIEMLLMAIAHVRVFSAAEYKFNPSRAPDHGLSNVLPIDQRRLCSDLQEVGSSRVPHDEHRHYTAPAEDLSPMPTSPRNSNSVTMSSIASGL